MRNSFVHVQPLSASSVSIFGVLFYNLWDDSFGRSWGDLCVSSLSLSLLQCSVESVKQLVPPLPPRSLSRTHAHTRTHTRAVPTALVVCSHSGQCLATGHARRRPDQHPAHVRNVPSAVQPGGGRGRRGRARSGCREQATREGERQEGAGTPDQGHRKGKTTSAKLFIFPKALQSAGGGGGGAGGCGAARASSARKCYSLSSSVITVQERERGFLLRHRLHWWFGPDKGKRIHGG